MKKMVRLYFSDFKFNYMHITKFFIMQICFLCFSCNYKNNERYMEIDNQDLKREWLFMLTPWIPFIKARTMS